LNHRIITRRALDARAELGWLADHAELIAARANSDVDDTQSSSSSFGGRGRSELTHPERHAERRLVHTDPVADAMHSLMTALDDVLAATWVARNAASRLVVDPDSHEAIRALAHARGKAGAGHCLNCGVYVPGIRSDRLRGGECEPCYRYRRDHHGNARPAELWEETPRAQLALRARDAVQSSISPQHNGKRPKPVSTDEH
jgi:hypothetical protein